MRPYIRSQEKKDMKNDLQGSLLENEEIESFYGPNEKYDHFFNSYYTEDEWGEDDELGSCYEPDESYDSFFNSDYFFDDLDYMYEEPQFLVEETWQDDDLYDLGDQGIGFLRYFMESVKPSEVVNKDILWVATKYTLLSASVLGGLFSSKFFEDKRISLILGRYAIALEGRLRESGIEFKTFEGLTQKGYDTLRELTGS